MDSAFKALADPTRRAILRLLNDGERTAGELAEQFPISAPSMSHHFSVLKQAGLIRSRREGQQIYYGLNTTVFQELMAAVMELFRSGEEACDEREDGVDRGRADDGGAACLLDHGLSGAARPDPDALEHPR
jgi:ArsR family transcriptional regulator